MERELPQISMFMFLHIFAFLVCVCVWLPVWFTGTRRRNRLCLQEIALATRCSRPPKPHGKDRKSLAGRLLFDFHFRNVL